MSSSSSKQKRKAKFEEFENLEQRAQSAARHAHRSEEGGIAPPFFRRSRRLGGASAEQALLKKVLEESKKDVPWFELEPRRSSRKLISPELEDPYFLQLLYLIEINSEQTRVLRLKNHGLPEESPSIVLDYLLDALKENDVCEVLYIQHYSGFTDDQLEKLMELLRLKRIWCVHRSHLF